THANSYRYLNADAHGDPNSNSNINPNRNPFPDLYTHVHTAVSPGTTARLGSLYREAGRYALFACQVDRHNRGSDPASELPAWQPNHCG
ncbi:MAG: hypothetical protein ACK2UU_01835, partial [Anaerolineae bacterium]